MLKRIELRSFKAFDRLDVQLKPFTVLVGTNGTGKTTLLQAIEFLASLVTGTIDTELDARTWLYGDLVHKLAPRNAFGFTAHLEFDGRPLRSPSSGPRRQLQASRVPVSASFEH